MMAMSNQTDAALAADIATGAGHLLMNLRATQPGDAKSLGAAGDAAAEAYIAARLREARPDDGYLSEEKRPDAARLQKRRVWIIDPLDGTREFGERERGDWAVHIALTIDGKPDACAVALPAQGLTFGTTKPQALPPTTEGPIRIVVSRSRAPAIAAQVAESLGAVLVTMGSAGAKAMAVVRGQAHAYLHAGGLNEWDSCAPVGVALAHGLHASRIDGSPCVYNQANPSMPDLLICRPELAAAMLTAIQSCKTAA